MGYGQTKCWPLGRCLGTQRCLADLGEGENKRIGELKHHIKCISSTHYLLGSRLERGTAPERSTPHLTRQLLSALAGPSPPCFQMLKNQRLEQRLQCYNLVRCSPSFWQSPFLSLQLHVQVAPSLFSSAGIPTLQHICKQWLAGNIPDLTLLQCLLPLHIYKELTVINTQLKC